MCVWLLELLINIGLVPQTIGIKKKWEKVFGRDFNLSLFQSYSVEDERMEELNSEKVSVNESILYVRIDKFIYSTISMEQRID